MLRRVCGPGIFDTASFALVPFSNRIAHGRFAAGGRDVALPPNFPGTDHPHPLHGFGWLADWTICDTSDRQALLAFSHEAGAWPWAFDAEQHIALDEDGLEMSLALTNRSSAPMPYGLGFHPYFPRDEDTVYSGLHRGEWLTDSEGLPVRLDRRDAACDWWGGAPVGSRIVDTVYEEREGPLWVIWPSRGIALRIDASANLAHTVVYTPAGADFFCAEPVSHRTDAFNRREGDPPVEMLEPGATARATIRLGPQRLAAGPDERIAVQPPAAVGT